MLLAFFRLRLDNVVLDSRDKQKPVAMPAPRQKLAIAAVFFTLTGFAMTTTGIPSLVTTIGAEMAVADSRFGWVFSLQFLCFAVASIIGGRVRRRFGITDRAMVVIGILVVAAAFAASHFVSTFFWVVLWIIPVGLAGGLTETFACVIVAKLSSDDSSKLLSFAQVFFCAGAVGTPYLIGLMLAADMPWRGILLLLSSFILLIGLFFIAATGSLKSALSQPANPPTSPQTASHRDWTFILLAAGMFLYVSVELAGASWLATYFQRNFELSAADGAWRPGLFWTGVMIGRASLLVLPHRWTVWPPAIMGAVGMAAGTVLIACSPTPFFASGAVLLYGLSAGPIWPVIVTISHNYGRSTRFTADIIAFGALGAAVGPLIASWIIGYKLSLLFPALATGGLLLLIAVIATKKHVNNSS